MAIQVDESDRQKYGLESQSFVVLLFRKSIAEATYKFGRRLFTGNVRYYLQDTAANKGLRLSLREEPNRIWFGQTISRV